MNIMNQLTKYIFALIVTFNAWPVYLDNGTTRHLSQSEFFGVTPMGYELKNTDMDKLIGGVGVPLAFDVSMVSADVRDYSVANRDNGDVATAVFVNNTTEQCSYTFEVISINGSVLETLESGVVAPGQTITSSVTPTVAFKGLGKGLRGRIWNENLPGIESQDYSLPK